MQEIRWHERTDRPQSCKHPGHFCGAEGTPACPPPTHLCRLPFLALQPSPRRVLLGFPVPLPHMGVCWLGPRG